MDPPITLADYQRGVLRDAFRAAVASGHTRPMLLPWALLPTILLPAVYVATAGRHRQLRRARVPLAVALAAWNAHTVVSQTDPPGVSSLNMAAAYGAGLVAAWGTLWTLTVLVWTADPWAGARVAQRRRANSSSSNKTKTPAAMSAAAPDDDIAQSLRLGYEYYWQPFPVEGSLFVRLDWSLDLFTAWRGSGWSWCRTPIPHFAPPPTANNTSAPLVDVDSLPLESTAGYRRHRTHAAFFRARLGAMAAGYLVLDLCAVVMTQDPYFVLGPPPDRARPWARQFSDVFAQPPPHAQLLEPAPWAAALASRSPRLLAVARSALGLVGIYAAMTLYLSIDAVLRVLYGRLFCRWTGRPTPISCQLWQFASLFGRPGAVADDGLAGFWGCWWHQTFRTAFLAPTVWWIGSGPGKKTATTPRHRAVALAVAFGQSALLHAAGSRTSMAAHACWYLPSLFFLVSGAGVALEAVAKVAAKRVFQRVCPSSSNKTCSWQRRLLLPAGRIAFAALCLHATQWLFFDDLARCGVWLFEPVPFSVVRWWLARGPDQIHLSAPRSSRAGHAAWRWYQHDVLYWRKGAHWWETGFAI